MSDKEDDATHAARELARNLRDCNPESDRSVSELAAAIRAYGEAQRRAGAEEARAEIREAVDQLDAEDRLTCGGECTEYPDHLPNCGVGMLRRAIESHADERGETKKKCGACAGTGKADPEFDYPSLGLPQGRCARCAGTGKERKP